VIALRGIEDPFNAVTALGFAEPELVAVFGDADGLGAAVEAELPVEVVAVTVCVVEEPVVSDVGAKADRT